jgi:DNA/RNA-binding protein KIN17
MKKERATMSDEARERVLIAEQIERAAADGGASSSSSSTTPPAEEGLKRDEGAEKVVLSFSAKPLPPTSATPLTNGSLKLNPLKPVNPLKANPLKKPNVFKASSNGEGSTTGKRSAPMSAAEQLIIEEQQRKRRRMDREAMS